MIMAFSFRPVAMVMVMAMALTLTSAFVMVPSPASRGAARSPVVVSLAPSKVQLGQKQLTISAPKPAEPETKQKNKTKRKEQTEVESAPMFRVFLLGDEEYPRDHVLLSLQEILPDCDNTNASKIFEEAQKTGQGLCGVYPEEHAELYVEQFQRAEPMIYSEMQEEGK
jgi:ATP-dependent Clp protease adapter protein ClpS